MSEKVSTITLRLTAEEAAQLEILKDIIGKKSGSEAIKYVVKEYPRFCTHYKQEAKEHGELKRKYREQGEAVRGFLSALDRLEKAGREKEQGETIASKIRSGRSWPMKYLLADVSGSCTRAA